MLNKDVCLHCYLHTIALNEDRKGDKDGLKVNDMKRFEARWKNHWVICLGIHPEKPEDSNEASDIGDTIPPWCRYTLEQTINEEDY